MLRLDLRKQSIGFDQFAFVDSLLCLGLKSGHLWIIAGLRRRGRLEGFELFCNFDQLVRLAPRPSKFVRGPSWLDSISA